MVTFEQFQEIDLRVVKILTAERVEASEKLLKLIVKDSEGERIIVAGIGKAYEPEALIGKEIVIIANLEPRTLMGIESQGMLLAVSDTDGKPVILYPEREVPPGTRLG
ncbi:MAG: methionine--tRNA ligase subunit beta [bacterium]|nr:methionine--tRNA ligase subunit beta [bacterium]